MDGSTDKQLEASKEHHDEINGCHNTRDVFYVRREVDLMKTAKVNA